MDVPLHEQLQYVGDAHTRITGAGISLYNSQTIAVRNAIEQIRNSFMPEGIAMNAPSCSDILNG